MTNELQITRTVDSSKPSEISTFSVRKTARTTDVLCTLYLEIRRTKNADDAYHTGTIFDRKSLSRTEDLEVIFLSSRSSLSKCKDRTLAPES